MHLCVLDCLVFQQELQGVLFYSRKMLIAVVEAVHSCWYGRLFSAACNFLFTLAAVGDV